MSARSGHQSSKKQFPTFLTPNEVLQLCRVETPFPRQLLAAWRKKGLEAVRIGARYHYTRDSVLQFLKKRTVPAGYVSVANAVARRAPGLAEAIVQQIREGKIPGTIAPDGKAFCPPEEIRAALEEVTS